MIYFVTGTDTDSGKTLIGSALLYKARQRGTTLGVKPIASGCDMTAQGLRNGDALSLMAQSSLKLPYEQVNPFAFAPAIAPHIAAKQAGQSLSVAALARHLRSLPFDSVDFSLIEGAGGWRLPLGEEAYLSDLVKALELPVILVVGLKLGALNHAVLTQEALLADGVAIAGWVANRVDPMMSAADENLQTLHEMMLSPCLGVVPYLDSPDVVQVASYLDINGLAVKNSTD